MISCHECGHECTEKDFENRINLCDHLSLDALAAFKRSKEQKPVSGVADSAERNCPRCQGLMRAEYFVDWANNQAFWGWRCLCCGNVWDRGMADNRAHAATPVKNHRPRFNGQDFSLYTVSHLSGANGNRVCPPK